MNLHLRKYAALPLACALLLPATMPAIADTPQETAYECAVTEGSTITWTPTRNLLKYTYAKKHEFTGAVQAIGGDAWRSEYAQVWEVDPAASRVVVGPTGKLESGEIRAKESNLAVALYNTKRTFDVSVNVFNPYIRIENPTTLVAGIGTNWVDNNKGTSGETEPVDIVRGEFDFTLNEDRTTGRLVPHADELGGIAPHVWLIPSEDPLYQAVRVGLRDGKEGRPYERAAADLNFTCTPFQRDVVATDTDQGSTDDAAASGETATKYCTIGENSTFAWGVKRSWRDYLSTFAAGQATHSANVSERLAQVQEHATMGFKDSKLESDSALPRQSRYQYLFPVDAQRSYVTLDANNQVVDLKVRSLNSWVRFKSTEHGFDNAILTPEAFVAGDQLKVAGTADVSMTPQGSSNKIEKVGNHAEFLRGQFTQTLSQDQTRLTIEHPVTGADDRNRITANSVYTKNSDSALVFAGTYDDGVEADPAHLDLQVTCRDITPENPLPELPARAEVTPLDRAAEDMPEPIENEYVLPGITAEATGSSVSADIPARPEEPVVIELGKPVFVTPQIFEMKNLPGGSSGQSGSTTPGSFGLLAGLSSLTNAGLPAAGAENAQVVAAQGAQTSEAQAAVASGATSTPKGQQKASVSGGKVAQRLAATGAEASALTLIAGLSFAVGGLLVGRRAKN